MVRLTTWLCLSIFGLAFFVTGCTPRKNRFVEEKKSLDDWVQESKAEDRGRRLKAINMIGKMAGTRKGAHSANALQDYDEKDMRLIVSTLVAGLEDKDDEVRERGIYHL